MELKGKKVVVTRARDQAGEMLALLREKGAVPILFPTIELVPPGDWGPVDAALGRMEGYHWVVFTSANGVRFFSDRAKVLGFDLKRLLEGKDVCAIGPATACALEGKGVSPTLVPPRFVAEEVLEALRARGMEGRRVLIPRAQVARDVLPQGLKGAGAQVDVVVVYRTVVPQVDSSVRKEVLEADIFTFTSPSTAQNFVRIMGEKLSPDFWRDKVVASIGPVTTMALRHLGVVVDLEAGEYTVRGLVRALEEFQP